jgi:hypothetical protein
LVIWWSGFDWNEFVLKLIKNGKAEHLNPFDLFRMPLVQIEAVIGALPSRLGDPAEVAKHARMIGEKIASGEWKPLPTARVYR